VIIGKRTTNWENSGGLVTSILARPLRIPSGYLTVCHGKCPIEIVDLPMKNGDFL